MGELLYVGKSPTTARHVTNVKRGKEILNAGVSRTYVNGRIADTIAGKLTGVVVPADAYATIKYVDAQDGQFVATEYYENQDTDLLIPNAAKGTANGVAELNTAGTPKIPDTQIPVMGAGICKGPFPIKTPYAVSSTFEEKAMIAVWELNQTNIPNQPWVFMSVLVGSTGGRPVIEVRVGDPTQTTYGSQTLVASGQGRSHYYGFQNIEVLPVDLIANDGQVTVPPELDFWSPNFNMKLTAWLFNDSGGDVSVTTDKITGAVYLLRMKE